MQALCLHICAPYVFLWRARIQQTGSRSLFLEGKHHQSIQLVQVVVVCLIVAQ